MNVPLVLLNRPHSAGPEADGFINELPRGLVEDIKWALYAGAFHGLPLFGGCNEAFMAALQVGVRACDRGVAKMVGRAVQDALKTADEVVTGPGWGRGSRGRGGEGRMERVAIRYVEESVGVPAGRIARIRPVDPSCCC